MIEDPLPGLKPGMSAEVRITVGAALENVLTVPVQAIIGAAEMGKQRKCFVLTPNGPEEREIIVGQSNEKMAEIKQGVREGEEVVLNPRVLVGDKAKTREPGRSKGGESAPPTEGGKGAPPASKDQPKRFEKTEAPMSGGSQPSAEDRQKRQQEMTEKFRKATPEQRKEMLEQIPEAFREKAREMLKAQGLEVK
jgi:hypothetical protein